MRIAVIGAGAIGGLIAAKLASAGDTSVSLLARGDTLQSIRRHGLRWRESNRLYSVSVDASDSAEKLGKQDLVIIAVKAHSLPTVASQLAPLLDSSTTVIPAMNGVPWWFLQTEPSFQSATLHSVDPDHSIAKTISLDQVLGCVIHISAATSEPGLVEHKMGRGLILGEPDGMISVRLTHISDILARAGFELTQSQTIRRDIWYKLWGNMTINPIAAITGATADRVLDDPLVRQFCSSVMCEAAAIGSRIGCHIEQQPEDRHKVTRKLGDFKPSMLQDVEAGRCIELDALLGIVRELGQIVGVETPNTDHLYGLTRLFAQSHGLMP